MVLKARKSSLSRSISRFRWSVAIVSVCLSILRGFRGRSGPKKAVLGHKMRIFGSAPPDLAPLPQGATAEFLGENSDLARAPPRL